MARHDDIDAGRMDAALQQLTRVSGGTVDAEPQTVGDHQVDAIEGHLTASTARVWLVRGSGLEAHQRNDGFAINRADREAVSHYIPMRAGRIENARRSGSLAASDVDLLQRRPDVISEQADTLITEQGFLSAAEKASDERSFGYIQGPLDD